ncbi:MAG: RNA polymerase sigma factor [Alkaliphilus sp.]
MLIYLSLLQDENEKNKFEQLYLEYKQIMFYVAKGILKDEHLAEDSLHQAFLKLVDNLDKINEIKCHKTKGFLVVIVKSVSLNILSKRKKQQVEPIDLYDSQIPIENYNLENEVIDKNEHDRLVQNILELPPKCANILILKYSLDLNAKEIAKIVGISGSDVRKRIQSGREKVLKALEERSDLVDG